LMSPTTSARMALTLDQFSGGRCLINAVAGGDLFELAGDGIFHDHDTRYALTDEFLAIWRRLIQGDEVTFAGQYIHIERGRLLFDGNGGPKLEIYFGGSSAAARALSPRGTLTSISPGASPRSRLRKRLPRFAKRRPPPVARCDSASVCM
jgi:alkanesulfonate monooxygenase